MISVCFVEPGLNLLHCMHIRRQDAKRRARTDSSNVPDVTELHGMFPAGMDLVHGLRCGSLPPSQLKAVPHSPVPIPFSPL